MAASQPQVDGNKPCPHCETATPEGARFCKSCGASLRAPPACPSCSSPAAPDAKFCAMCATALVGPRPRPTLVPDPDPAPAPVPEAVETAETQETDDGAAADGPEPKLDVDAARSELAKEAAKLPPAKPPANSIISNVLLFVAFLMVLVVGIYISNKDAEKTVSPFESGPPMASTAAKPAEPPNETSAPAAAPSAAVTGRVELGEGVQGTGTLFIILRQAGVGRGPPVAVRKVDAPNFPQSFSLSSADTMVQGMPFTGPFDIHVRLDQDGNAMTKMAGDLTTSAPATGVKPGDAPVVVTLDKRL